MRDDEEVHDREEDRECTEDEGNHSPSQMERSFTMDDAPGAEEGPDAGQHGPNKGGTWGRGEGRGHRERICSQCCVELGTEGEVRCLGCLEIQGPL